MDERGGFMKAESLDEAHENMVLNLNPVQGFCDECIELSDDGLLTRSEVYKQYETWCKEEGRHPVTARKFWGRFRTVMARRIGRPWVIDEREAKRGGVRRVPGICFAPSVVTFPPAVK
jgi:phage/plasmid-associated DNA primase